MSPAHARAEVAHQPAVDAPYPVLFEEFVRKYQQYVMLAAYRITRNIDDARDVAQLVFMKTFLSLPPLDDQRSVDRWLYVVTRNEALSVNRRRKRDDAVENFSREELPDLDLEAIVLRNDRAREVRATIAALPSAYRDVIELRHLFSMPTAEIAQHLGIPVKHVKRDVERAKTRLRIEMVRRGLDDEAGHTLWR